jgi:hypothetical protein
LIDSWYPIVVLQVKVSKMFNVKLAKEKMERLFRRANTHNGDSNTKEKGENNKVAGPHHFNADPDRGSDSACFYTLEWYCISKMASTTL